MRFTRLPRKLKKALKKAVLKGKDPRWKSDEVKINGIRLVHEYQFKYPNRKVWPERHKNFMVDSYSLGW